MGCMEQDGISKVFVARKHRYNDPETTGEYEEIAEAIQFFPRAGESYSDLRRVKYKTSDDAPTTANGKMDVFVTNTTYVRPLQHGDTWRRGDPPRPALPAYYRVARVADHLSHMISVGDEIDVTGLDVINPDGMQRLVEVLETRAGRKGPEDGPGLSIFTA